MGEGGAGKGHKKAKAGAKARKKGVRKGSGSRAARSRTVAAPIAGKKASIKAAEKEQRRLSAPSLQPEALRSSSEGAREDPPLVVAVAGPSQVSHFSRTSPRLQKAQFVGHSGQEHPTRQWRWRAGSVSLL